MNYTLSPPITPSYLAYLEAKSTGDKQAIAESQALYFITPEGQEYLRSQGKHWEAMMATALASTSPFANTP